MLGFRVQGVGFRVSERGLGCGAYRVGAAVLAQGTFLVTSLPAFCMAMAPRRGGVLGLGLGWVFDKKQLQQQLRWWQVTGTTPGPLRVQEFGPKGHLTKKVPLSY